jgi:hypothetical protein
MSTTARNLPARIVSEDAHATAKRRARRVLVCTLNPWSLTDRGALDLAAKMGARLTAEWRNGRLTITAEEG